MHGNDGHTRVRSRGKRPGTPEQGLKAIFQCYVQRTWTQGKSASSGLLHNCTQFSMSWAPKAGLEICYVEFGKLCLMTVRNIHNVRASLLTPEKAFFLSSMASEPHVPPPMPSCLLTPSSCWSSQADSLLPGLTRLFPSQDVALSPMPLLWVPSQGGCLFPFKEIFTGHSPPHLWHHPWSPPFNFFIFCHLPRHCPCVFLVSPTRTWAPMGRDAALVQSLLTLNTEDGVRHRATVQKTMLNGSDLGKIYLKQNLEPENPPVWPWANGSPHICSIPREAGFSSLPQNLLRWTNGVCL